MVIALHCLAELRNLGAVAVVNVLLHIGVIIMLLLLAAELRQVFVFLLGSVTADLLIRLIARHLSQKKAESAAKAAAQDSVAAEERPITECAPAGGGESADMNPAESAETGCAGVKEPDGKEGAK